VGAVFLVSLDGMSRNMCSLLFILSLTVGMIRRVLISSDVLVISCLYSGICPTGLCSVREIFFGRILFTVRFNSSFVYWQNLLLTILFCIKLLFISTWILAVELL